MQKLRKPEYFKTWITRILINECRKILRQNKNVVSIEEYQEKRKEEAKEHNKEEIMDLEIAIQQLPKRQKDVIMLYYYNDLKIEEIASLLEIPKGTVKSRLNSARNYLYEILSKEGRGKNAR